MPRAGADRPRNAPLQVELPLPLPLTAASGLPGRMEPEMCVPCATAFDNPDWRFSVDWAGMRVILAGALDGTVRVHDERMRDVTALVPEIAGSARTALRGRAAAVDGVVAVLDDEGCPDLGALAGRLWERPASPGAVPPVALLVTDLLHLDGVALLRWPFDRRHQALRGLLDPAPHLQVPDWVEGDGLAITAAAADRGLPAVLARLGSAPYHAGIASPQRLRIGVRDEVDCVVSGVVTGPRGAVVDALLLAEWEDGRLVDAGRVAVVERERARALLARTQPLRTAGRVVEDAGAAEPGTVWLQPALVATVRFHGRAADRRLRLPALVALREDVDPERCRRREPVEPPASGGLEHAAFRPTVLTTLPLGD